MSYLNQELAGMVLMYGESEYDLNNSCSSYMNCYQKKKKETKTTESRTVQKVI